MGFERCNAKNKGARDYNVVRHWLIGQKTLKDTRSVTATKLLQTDFITKSFNKHVFANNKSGKISKLAENRIYESGLYS